MYRMALKVHEEVPGLEPAKIQELVCKDTSGVFKSLQGNPSSQRRSALKRRVTYYRAAGFFPSVASELESALEESGEVCNEDSFDPLQDTEDMAEARALRGIVDNLVLKMRRGALAVDATSLGRSVEAVLEEIKSAGGATSVKRSESNCIESIFFSTKSQIKRGKSLGGLCVCVDGTFSTDEAGWVLITASVVDGNRKVRAVGHAISQGDLATYHTDLLGFLCGASMKITTVIADQRVKEKHVVEGAPGAKSLVAGWHHVKAISKHLGKFGSEGKSCLGLLIKMVQTQTREETDGVVSDLNALLAGPTYEKLRGYVNAQIKDRGRTAGHARYATFTGGYTEGVSEIWNSAHKRGATATEPIIGTIKNLLDQEGRHVRDDGVVAMVEGSLLAQGTTMSKVDRLLLTTGDMDLLAALAQTKTLAAVEELSWNIKEARGALFGLSEGYSRDKLEFTHEAAASRYDPRIKSCVPVGTKFVAKIEDGVFFCPCSRRREHVGLPCEHEAHLALFYPALGVAITEDSFDDVYSRDTAATAARPPPVEPAALPAANPLPDGQAMELDPAPRPNESEGQRGPATSVGVEIGSLRDSFVNLREAFQGHGGPKREEERAAVIRSTSALLDNIRLAYLSGTCDPAELAGSIAAPELAASTSTLSFTRGKKSYKRKRAVGDSASAKNSKASRKCSMCGLAMRSGERHECPCLAGCVNSSGKGGAASRIRNTEPEFKLFVRTK
jgi:hypothetical protein